jgi:hypothetical protein
MMTTTIIMVAVRLVGAITCGSVMDARSCWRRSSSQGPTSVACIIRTESKMRQTVGDSQSLAILLSLIGDSEGTHGCDHVVRARSVQA